MLLSLLQPSKSDVWDLSLLERLSNVIDNCRALQAQPLLRRVFAFQVPRYVP